MRGASKMLHRVKRIDEGNRGVRVSHMDSFDSKSLGDNEHMQRALVLASEVQSAEGIVGEYVGLTIQIIR